MKIIDKLIAKILRKESHKFIEENPDNINNLLKKLEDMYEAGYRDGESSCEADIAVLKEEHEDEINKLLK